jgi:hypothetical protein
MDVRRRLPAPIGGQGRSVLDRNLRISKRAIVIAPPGRSDSIARPPGSVHVDHLAPGTSQFWLTGQAAAGWQWAGQARMYTSLPRKSA